VTVSPGLLDRRVRLYAPADGGADGFVRTVYVLTGEWWARLDETADAEQVPLSPQSHVEGRIAGVLTVADYVPVPRGGIAREVDSQQLFHVRGIVAQRALRAQRVTVEAIAPAQHGEYDIYDDVDALDGTHLIDPNGTAMPAPVPVVPRAYGVAFSSAFG
jgi:hypothetical protein